MFRVLAANRAGYGLPSESTLPVRLVPPASLQRLEDTHHYHTAGFQTTTATLPATPQPPIVSRVVAEGTAAVVEWLPVDDSSSGVVVGYLVEYRPVLGGNVEEMQWIPANDHLVPLVEGGPTRLVVTGLRPNGDYEFRVVARNDDGQWSKPSASSGPVRMRPDAPKRVDGRVGGDAEGSGVGAGIKRDPQLPQPGAPAEAGRSGGELWGQVLIGKTIDINAKHIYMRGGEHGTCPSLKGDGFITAKFS